MFLNSGLKRYIQKRSFKIVLYVRNLNMYVKIGIVPAYYLLFVESDSRTPVLNQLEIAISNRSLSLTSLRCKTD